jgi:hypothetical protein
MMPQYYTVVTSLGLAKMAAAQAAGEAVQLHTLHAGTGGGDGFYDQYDEAALMALDDLIGEMWSSQINQMDVDAQNPNWLVIEATIPSDTGGFMVREVGIKDIDGDLIAIGRFPATYKPVLSDGAAQDLLLRVIMEVSNAASVTLEIDPSMVMASRRYVDEEVDKALIEAKAYADDNSLDVTLRPANLSPSEGEPGITATPELVGADYYALYHVPQEHREFQIVRAGYSFSAPVYTAIELAGADGPAVRHTVASPLQTNTAYQWRYRDRTIEGDTSAWSPVTGFTTADTYVARPTLLAPASGEQGVLEQPTLEASAFEVVNGNDEHAATSWRIRDVNGNTVWSVIESSEHLTSIDVPSGYLEEGREYTAQVRYHGEMFGDSAWSTANTFTTAEQFAGAIGEAGGQGFGVSAYPGDLPSGFTALSGHNDKASDNYGNYQYSDGSILCFVPAFYYRIGHPDSPRHATYGANAIDVLGLGVFTDRNAAAAAGYALHRAFIDGGATKSGFFIDKYLNSKNAGNNAGRSVKGGVPISLTTSTSYTRSGDMTGCAGQLHDAITLSRSRGAGFNCASVFMYSALALLALAHGQAATGATHCAWYDPAGTTNYPKGCNASLSDVDDSSVTFESAGDSGDANKPRAGSGTPFAKTTHNGQACGVADVNGSLWQVALGITTPGTSATSTTQVSNGNCYVLKESVALASLTAGFGGATDAWGAAANLAANYDQADGILPWGSATGAVYFGNGANQVFSADTSGQNWLRTACGVQASNNSMSATGTNLFGQDYCFQYNRHNLFVLCGGHWANGSSAGVFARYWNSGRTSYNASGGFRAAAYGL